MTDIKEATVVSAHRDESGLPVDKVVFGIAAVMSVGFVLVGALWPEDVAEVTS